MHCIFRTINRLDIIFKSLNGCKDELCLQSILSEYVDSNQTGYTNREEERGFNYLIKLNYLI